jgi:hypothetical protein
MTGHHDPRFPDLPADLEDVTAELARYADVTEESAPGGFADRVMAAIAAEPAAGRRSGVLGLLGAWLTALSGPARSSLRMAAVAAVVVLAVGGALVAGELSGLLRQGPTQAGSSGSPTASPTMTVSPSPSPTPTLQPTESPGPSNEATDQPQSTGSIETSLPASRTPRATATEDGASKETPQPAETPQPTSSSSSGDH